ncbi:1-phosphofructokinase [Thermocoleostomius sinensis]|uniref:1-phosphofructokinase n=1 Tax=Thermocoleostomius sinensis A174 TaxID=2016057 RepID=A0A9E8ZCG1_9CYAN|nr:1-phosphofructokinase [Thermocoleostomius sinensis]WAL60715.1 1-phosphofructokinase [Thermocoleostomius sinensis A174]
MNTMFSDSSTPRIATLTLNPAIDQTVAIPNFRAGTVNRVGWEQSDPGGKGVNVASFLAAFGFSVTVSGFLGHENAELFQTFFAHQGLCDRFLLIPGKTRVNVKIIDDAQEQVTDINFPGPSPTPEEITALHQRVDELAIDHDWFIVSGSLPASVSPNLYRDLTQRLKSQGKTVILDASGDSFRQALTAIPFAIKPNIDELQEYLGVSLRSEIEVLQAARGLVAEGIECVVVSMGAGGAIFVEADSAVWARPPQVNVISTVGAGDAMVAGLVAGKLRGFALADCARLATAFSIATLSQVGPRLPLPDRVEALMEQVQIEDLHSARF